MNPPLLTIFSGSRPKKTKFIAVTGDSIQRAQKYAVSINDALALTSMEQEGINEIYTFDRHFERMPVRCVQE